MYYKIRFGFGIAVPVIPESWERLRNCLNLIRKIYIIYLVGSLRSFMVVFTKSHKILSMNLTIKFKQFLRKNSGDTRKTIYKNIYNDFIRSLG